MGGVPCIRIVKTNDIDDLVQALEASGVHVQPVTLPPGKTYPDLAFCCSLDGSKTEVWFVRDKKLPDDAFVQIPYPPYQIAFWRWSGDSRLFDKLFDTTESFVPSP